MPLKIGQTVHDPITGHRGWVNRFIGGVAICKSYEDGTYFKLAGRQYRKKPVEVRMEGVFDWLAAEKIGKEEFRITANDPVWHGAVIQREEVEVRK